MSEIHNQPVNERIDDERLKAMLADIAENKCPTCQCPWDWTRPARIDGAAGFIRCVNCKAVYNDPAPIRALITELLASRKLLAEAGEALKAYAAFSDEVLGWAADGQDPDGADIQDAAVAAGLLVKVPFDPERHNVPDWLAGEVEPGDDYFEASPLLLRASKTHTTIKGAEHDAR